MRHYQRSWLTARPALVSCAALGLSPSLSMPSGGDHQAWCRFALARVKQDLLARLRAFGLAGKICEDLLFPTLPTAVDAYRQWAKQHDRPPGSDTGTTS